MLKVDIDLIRPELGPQLLAGDQFAGSLQKKGQDLKGLGGEADSSALPAQLARVEIRLKISELHKARQEGTESPRLLRVGA
jgi:hypothetical protein